MKEEEQCIGVECKIIFLYTVMFTVFKDVIKSSDPSLICFTQERQHAILLVFDQNKFLSTWVTERELKTYLLYKANLEN